jgi:hypothetical protein
MSLGFPNGANRTEHASQRCSGWTGHKDAEQWPLRRSGEDRRSDETNRKTDNCKSCAPSEDLDQVVSPLGADFREGDASRNSERDDEQGGRGHKIKSHRPNEKKISYGHWD